MCDCREMTSSSERLTLSFASMVRYDEWWSF